MLVHQRVLIRGLLLLQTSWLGQNFGCRIPSKSQLPTDFEALFVTWSHIFVYHLYPLVNVQTTNWKINMLLIGKPVNHLFLWAMASIHKITDLQNLPSAGWKKKHHDPRETVGWSSNKSRPRVEFEHQFHAH